jgi:hypothetical protein
MPEQFTWMTDVAPQPGLSKIIYVGQERTGSDDSHAEL